MDRPPGEAIADFVPALKAGLDAIMAPGSDDGAVLQDAWTKLSEGAETVAKGLGHGWRGGVRPSQDDIAHWPAT